MLLPASAAQPLRPSPELAGQQGQQGIVPQEVMVVEIFVSQGDAGDALRDQRAHRVLVRRGSRRSVKQAATRSNSPIERSIPRSNRVPAFEVIEPPSNAAITLLPRHP